MLLDRTKTMRDTGPVIGNNAGETFIFIKSFKLVSSLLFRKIQKFGKFDTTTLKSMGVVNNRHLAMAENRFCSQEKCLSSKSKHFKNIKVIFGPLQVECLVSFLSSTN